MNVKSNIMTIEELSEEYVKSTLIGSESIKKSAFKAGANAVLKEIEEMLRGKGYLIETLPGPVIYDPKEYGKE